MVGGRGGAWLIARLWLDISRAFYWHGMFGTVAGFSLPGTAFDPQIRRGAASCLDTMVLLLDDMNDHD